MNKYWFYKVGLVVVFLCFALLGEAKVKLPTLVSDGMVLQRGEPVNIWGTADPDETVSITFQKKKYKTVADAQGNWKVILPALKQKGAEVDLSSVFANSVKKVVRTVILDQKDHLEVTDRLETGDKEAAVSWIMVTPAEAKITGKNRMELTKDGQRMLLTVDADTEVEMKTWSNVPPHEYDFRNPGTIRVGFETVIPANRASQLKVRLIPLK